MVGARILALAMGGVILFSATNATATEPREKNAALRPLLDCRKLAGESERLACFDRESATLDAADVKNEITVLDKEAVRETRRSLFGFTLPRLPLLGGGKDDKDDAAEAEESSLSATIASARSLGYGKWSFVLDDGARWETIEAVVSKEPAKGMNVVIKKGAIGSYMVNFDGSRGVRSRRVN